MRDDSWRELSRSGIEVLLCSICSNRFVEALAHIRWEEVRLVLLEESLNTEGVDKSEAFVNRVIEVDFIFFVVNLDFGC